MAKRSQRSSPYPSYTIEHCIDLVAKIYSNFGSGNYYAKREEIAKVLGFSAAHLQSQVSSANQYGFLDLKTGEGYKPSGLFVSIYRPINEEGKRSALIQAFRSPSLYSALIEKFEGQILPSEIPLSNIVLHHHNISEGANEKAANVFIENAKYLDLLKSDNILTLNGGHAEGEVEEEEPNEENEDAPENQNHMPLIIHQGAEQEKNKQDSFKGGGGFIPFNIPLKGKDPAQIIVPENVKSTDFDFIINFINLMKQQFD